MEHIVEFLRSMDEPEMADEVANALEAADMRIDELEAALKMAQRDFDKITIYGDYKAVQIADKTFTRINEVIGE